tara:strand:- start:4266 stop:4451 length:186 start_codon:yes stop_codon:yes gene_type:complete
MKPEVDPSLPFWIQYGIVVVVVCLLFYFLGRTIGKLMWKRYADRGLKLAKENEELRQATLN